MMLLLVVSSPDPSTAHPAAKAVDLGMQDGRCGCNNMPPCSEGVVVGVEVVAMVALVVGVVASTIISS